MVKSKSFGARVFVVVNALVIGLLAASCLIPLIHVFAISLSDKSSASGGLVALWPVKFTLESYKYVINRAPFWTAMLVSLKRVLVGVSLNMFFLHHLRLSAEQGKKPVPRPHGVCMVFLHYHAGFRRHDSAVHGH